MTRTTEPLLTWRTVGLTLSWLGVGAVMGLSASCRPDLSLGEVDAGAGGEATEAVGGSSGSPATFVMAGKGGSISQGGSSGRGGSTGSQSTGGSSTTGGSSSTGGASSTGGDTAMGGESSTGGANATGGVGPLGGSAGTGGTAGVAPALECFEISGCCTGTLVTVLHPFTCWEEEVTCADGCVNEGECATDADYDTVIEKLCGPGGAVSSPSQVEIEEQTILRWNAVADHRPPNEYEFHWEKDYFPHPTFKLGTPEGYHEFAFVLDGFLAEHFEFLAQYHQFLTPYYYVTASTSDEDLEVTWDSLATDFSTMEYGDIPADVQARLAEHAADMKQYE